MVCNIFLILKFEVKLIEKIRFGWPAIEMMSQNGEIVNYVKPIQFFCNTVNKLAMKNIFFFRIPK